jgi:gamma-glutamyl-gamma-aminobutyrate hydrolase PuuD
MKWLVTDTMGGDGDVIQNYLKWLNGQSIRSKVLRPPATAPEDVRTCSALLLTGGGDVDPALYGENPAPEVRHTDRVRDDMEIELIRAFVDAGKPVFGICRGIQILNVAFGGKLIQHIPERLRAERSPEEHGQMNEEDSVHSVRFDKDSLLADVLEGVTEVNSSHHQSVDPDALGKNLVITAVSEGGIVEAVEGADLGAPVIAVQWHPERWHQNAEASERLLDWMKGLAAGS